MGRARHARCTGEINLGFWRGKLREIALFEGLGIVGRLILKWIIKKWNED